MKKEKNRYYEQYGGGGCQPCTKTLHYGRFFLYHNISIDAYCVVLYDYTLTFCALLAVFVYRAPTVSVDSIAPLKYGNTIALNVRALRPYAVPYCIDTLYNNTLHVSNGFLCPAPRKGHYYNNKQNKKHVIFLKFCVCCVFMCHVGKL